MPIDQQRHQRIQQKAYQLWEQGQRSHGNDLAHWLQAEREITELDQRVRAASDIEVKRPRRAPASANGGDSSPKVPKRGGPTRGASPTRR